MKKILKNLIISSSLLLIGQANAMMGQFNNQNNNLMMWNNNWMMQNNQLMNQNPFMNHNQFMNWNPFMNHNQIFNNNIAMHNRNLNNNRIDIKDFYRNHAIVKQYLNTRIAHVNTNGKGMRLNEQTCNNFDWQLLLFNMANSKSAKTNVKYVLNSLIGSSIYNDILSDLFDFYSRNFKTRKEVHSNEVELFAMIANYYISNIISGNNDISAIQNSLQTLSHQQSWMLPMVLQNYGFQSYYTNYYLPRLNSGNHNAQLFNGIPLNNSNINDWNKAINMIKQIDLAGTIKKLILGINVGEILFDKELCNKTNNRNKNRILLNNGNSQCWLHSSLHLVNSAVECSSSVVKHKLQSNNTIILS